MRLEKALRIVSSGTVRGAILATIVLLEAGQVSAHVIPWREGVSRQTGFGVCAKGPCLRRTDFSPTVPHVHLAIKGRDTVVLCTGLGRKPDACSAISMHRRTRRSN